MNYDQPRQLKSGGWHYTTMNDGRVGAIGYCMDHRDTPHATEDEARACYRNYQLEQRTRLDGTVGHYNPCEAPSGCGTLSPARSRPAAEARACVRTAHGNGLPSKAAGCPATRTARQARSTAGTFTGRTTSPTGTTRDSATGHTRLPGERRLP